METKVYVFITYDIHPVGGSQAYIAGKSRYLEKLGWKVYVLFSGRVDGICKIKNLNKYLNGGIEELKHFPYEMCECTRNRVVQEMIKRIQIDDAEEIIVESHHDVDGFWGELLAEEIGGRHYIFPCSDNFRGINEAYEPNLDFFKFKLERNELLTPQAVVRKMFNGYMGITESKIDYPSLVIEQDPVGDVENEKLDRIKKADYNICSIGRLEKPYIAWAFEGVREFALLYPQKTVNFIIVGDETVCRGKIKETNDDIFQGMENVNLIYLGVLIPIPRKLFSIADVVIATAQTAVFVSHEHVYTITANTFSRFTPGVLGYDTQDAWWGDISGKKTYCDVLIDVLVKDAYQRKTFSMPKHEPAEYHYQKQWEYFRLASKKREYYTKTFKSYRPTSWTAIFPFWKIGKGEKILMYGAGKVGHDYLRQIRLTDYCVISCIVDKRADQYDDSVVFPEEGFAKSDYEAIVIAIASEEDADEVKKYILKNDIVKRVVHDIVFS